MHFTDKPYIIHRSPNIYLTFHIEKCIFRCLSHCMPSSSVKYWLSCIVRCFMSVLALARNSELAGNSVDEMYYKCVVDAQQSKQIGLTL